MGEIVYVLQERGPLPGPKTGLLSNTRKWIVRGDTSADRARDFIGKGRPGREQQGEGTQEDRSATWLAGFMVMGFVSGFPLASHWLRVLSGGECLVQPRWRPARRILGGGQTCGVSFWPFPHSYGWWWLISSVFLTTMQMVTLVPGRVGDFSRCAPPNIQTVLLESWAVTCLLVNERWRLVESGVITFNIWLFNNVFNFRIFWIK